jgi:hypothetical protein
MGYVEPRALLLKAALFGQRDLVIVEPELKEPL